MCVYTPVVGRCTVCILRVCVRALMCACMRASMRAMHAGHACLSCMRLYCCICVLFYARVFVCLFVCLCPCSSFPLLGLVCMQCACLYECIRASVLCVLSDL